MSRVIVANRTVARKKFWVLRVMNCLGWSPKMRLVDGLRDASKDFIERGRQQ